MNDRIAQTTYRTFIDKLVITARSSMKADRLTAHGHTERANGHASPMRPEEATWRDLCLGLDASQKTALAQLLVDEREAAVHDVLAYLEWCVVTQKLQITGPDGPIFESAEESMLLDFVSRLGGHEWEGV